MKQGVVAAFHNQAHILSCQYEFNPRTTIGAGMADYEGNERLWSLLRSLVGRTRNVT